jgi:hypothetical protein
MKKIILILASYVVLSGSAQAYQVGVWQKVYRPSCSYFTNVSVDYRVLVNLPELDDKAYKAELHLGWNGLDAQTPFSWKNRQIVASSRKIGKTFLFSVSNTLINRGSPVQITGLSFRIKLTAENGAVKWISGNRFPLSYYEVKTSHENSPCMGQQKIAFKRTSVKVNERNDY